MPVIPEIYPGLTTRLSQVWNVVELEEVDTEDDDDELKDILIYSGAGIGGCLILCCLCYYCCICCAKGSHKVTYLDP